MPRVLRFFWQHPDSPYTAAEWLCVPFVMLGHVILGVPFFLYVLLGMPSRAQNKFHTEQSQRARREWENRETLRRQGRVIEGAAADRFPDPTSGCFLWHLHNARLWWVDAEPASLQPLSRDSPPLKDPHAHGHGLYRQLLDEEHGRALLLEFSCHQSSVEYQDRIPQGRLLYISDSPFNNKGPALMCVAPLNDEESAELFPESESTYVSNREQKPFWGRYWKFIGMGYLAFALLLVLPLLPLIVVLPWQDWLSVGACWLGASIGLGTLLMMWERRRDFMFQQERSWWRPILRWGVPSFIALYMYVVPFGLCYEAGEGERYLVCLALHLTAYALWRGLMPRWHDPFAEEFQQPQAFESDETGCAVDSA